MWKRPQKNARFQAARSKRNEPLCRIRPLTALGLKRQEVGGHKLLIPHHTQQETVQNEWQWSGFKQKPLMWKRPQKKARFQAAISKRNESSCWLRNLCALGLKQQEVGGHKLLIPHHTQQEIVENKWQWSSFIPKPKMWQKRPKTIKILSSQKQTQRIFV